MHSNCSKSIFLTTELKAEPQLKATIARMTQYKVQIARNKDELERLKNASLHMYEDRCDSPWYHKSFENFETFITPPWTLVIFAEPQ